MLLYLKKVRTNAIFFVVSTEETNNNSHQNFTFSKNSSKEANARDLKHSAKSPLRQAAFVLAKYGSVSGPVPRPIQSSRSRPVQNKKHHNGTEIESPEFFDERTNNLGIL